MGAVIELRAGNARLRLVPALGGRISACLLEDAGGRPHPVLQPYPEVHTDLDAWAKGGLYPLVPYSGRIRVSRLLHDGREWPLAPHGAGPHTLHGIAQRRPWQVLAAEPASARLCYVHAPDAHWPWPFEAGMSLSLAPHCVQVRLQLRNTGPEAMPGGIGLHPYLLHDAREEVRYTAGAAWPFDADYLALPRKETGGALSCHRLSAQQFAAGGVTLFHDDWRGPLSLMQAGDSAPRLQLQATGALTQLVLHRPANAGYLCVEPVSHVADGFNLHARGQAGTGTRVLEAGEVLDGAMMLTG